MSEEKIVYVWKSPGLKGGARSLPVYCTRPRLPGHISGSGPIESLVEEIRRIKELDSNYRLVLDKNPEGENFPLDEEDRIAFSEVE